MAEKLKKGDFVNIDFVARLKTTNKIFDLTKEDIAKKENMFQPNREYKPIVICLGAGHLLKGVDKAIEGKEIGAELEFDVKPEDAFGLRNPKHIRVTSLKQFKDKKVNPFPGMQLLVDGVVTTIRSVTGGRVIIDFNHPLAGKTLHYWIKINKKLVDTKEKITGLFSLLSEIKDKDYTIKITDKTADIDVKLTVPDEILNNIKKQIKKLIPEITEINIKMKK